MIKCRNWPLHLFQLLRGRGWNDSRRHERAPEARQRVNTQTQTPIPATQDPHTRKILNHIVRAHSKPVGVSLDFCEKSDNCLKSKNMIMQWFIFPPFRSSDYSDSESDEEVDETLRAMKDAARGWFKLNISHCSVGSWNDINSADALPEWWCELLSLSYKYLRIT